EDIGSWKIIETSRPRTLAIRARCLRRALSFRTSFGLPPSPRCTVASFSLPARRLIPRNQMAPEAIRPGGVGIRYMIESAVTDFPHPLSPTRPRTSPSWISKSTPSAARITPRGVRNSVCNPWTDSKGGSPSPPEPRVEDDAQVQGHLHEDRGQGVRQDMAEHDPQIRCAGRSRRLDEHVRLHGQDLRADEPRVGGPP